MVNGVPFVGCELELEVTSCCSSTAAAVAVAGLNASEAAAAADACARVLSGASVLGVAGGVVEKYDGRPSTSSAYACKICF